MPDAPDLRDKETRERLLAEAHTAGDYPWFIADGDDLNYDTGEPYMHTDAPTAAHIANWSPATALAALELIGELARQVDDVRRAMDWRSARRNVERSDFQNRSDDAETFYAIREALEPPR